MGAKITISGWGKALWEIHPVEGEGLKIIPLACPEHCIILDAATTYTIMVESDNNSAILHERGAPLCLEPETPYFTIIKE